MVTGVGHGGRRRVRGSQRDHRRHYEKLSKEKVDALFFGDHTHTSPTGATLNAGAVVEGLRGLKDCALCKYLK